MEDYVIADIARRVKKMSRYTESAELMAKFMVEQGYSAQKIRAEVMKKLRADKEYQKALAENTKAYKQEIQNIIEETVEKAKQAGNTLISKAGNMAWNNDLSMWEQQGVDLSKPNTMAQLIKAFQKQTTGELKNLTGSMGFKGTVLGTTGILAAFQHEMDRATLMVSVGVISYDEAIKDCVHKLAQSGLRTIDYASGRSYQLDTAARMCVRTGMSQLAGRIMEENLQSTGQDLVITSQHIGSRPEHVPWQNKVFSYTGKNKKYPDFRKSTGYGTVEGLKGANCTHDFFPFFEGSSIIPEDVQEPAPVRINGKEYTYYQATQQQRKMERGIRATKREIEATRAIDGDVTELKKSLRNQTKEYMQFSKDAKLRPKENRLRVESGTSNLKKTKAWKTHSIDEDDVKNLVKNIINKANDHSPIGIKELPKTHVARINSIIDAAPQLVKEFTLGKLDEIKFINEKYLGTPHNASKGIRINLKGQETDKRGSYTALFHEVGHSLDAAYGDVSVLHVFKLSLQKDFEGVVNSYCKHYNMSKDEAFVEIGDVLKADKLHAISDLCSALSDDKCAGHYKHLSSYWKQKTNALEKEAFAHFYEATIRNDKEKLNAIKQMFPNAYKIFEDMLR